MEEQQIINLLIDISNAIDSARREDDFVKIPHAMAINLARELRNIADDAKKRFSLYEEPKPLCIEEERGTKAES